MTWQWRSTLNHDPLLSPSRRAAFAPQRAQADGYPQRLQNMPVLVTGLPPSEGRAQGPAAQTVRRTGARRCSDEQVWGDAEAKRQAFGRVGRQGGLLVRMRG